MALEYKQQTFFPPKKILGYIGNYVLVCFAT